MTRIAVNSELLTWARERSGLESLALAVQLHSETATPKKGTHG